VTGFTDLAPIVREQTVKAVLTVIGKLSDRTINGELLKYLAKTSNDEQPGIRTNTTICLGKISKHLGVGSRSKVLIAAFTRSLRDPFVHARNAALLAMSVTSEHFTEDDSASKILPSLCPCLIDKEKLIRDQANKTMEIYLQRVRKFASTMPDSVLPPPTTAEATATTPRMSTPQPSEAASWAGWAISSFTNKISTAAGEIEPNSNGTPISATRPSSAPTPNDTRRLAPGTASASTLHRQAVASPAVTSARTSTSSIQNDYFRDTNADDDNTDAWDDMQEEAFFDAPSQVPKVVPSAANPFGDEGEPDFAGWLAAQAGKKSGSKPLPKGLAKSGSSTANRPAATTQVVSTGSSTGLGAKKAVGTALKSKPVVAKKIDTAPKDTDNDDGWGDKW
jgi:SCY1-like protein 1